MRGRRRPRWAAAALAFAMLGPAAAAAPALAAPGPTARSGSAVVAPTRVIRSVRCPESRFTCITIRVPRDHFKPADRTTVDVTFALLRASSGHRTGVFVTATGGPGTSGIAVADSYTDAFDPGITARYDIVFFDQRGIGRSGPLQCPRAAVAFYTTAAVPTVSTEQAFAYAAAASTFSRDCVAEAGVTPSSLAFYATRQVAEDLDDVRAVLGATRLDLYGESYGTQLVQTYAAAHPGRVRSLMLDGPVDLTLSGYAYYSEDARAFDSTLAMTLRRCGVSPLCRRDLGGADALGVYDRLAAQLRNGPITYDHVLPSGAIVQREFGLSNLESAAAEYVYSTYDRMLLQRAIAQAARGRIAPLARLASLAVGQDPDTLLAATDPTWSDALYYAVECMDYQYTSRKVPGSVAAYLQAGRLANLADVRLGSVFYGDLPCATWPTHPATSARPAPLTRTPYPVFVFASTTDPATPWAGALRIYERAANAYLVVAPGGPHIIFGRGAARPDDLVTAFLVDGTRPAHRRTTCPPAYVDPYVRVPAATIDGYASGLEAMAATDGEIVNGADYWAWDGVGRLSLGCLFGGWMTYLPATHGYRIALHHCAFSGGLPLTGSGLIRTTDDSFELRATAPGGTSLAYVRRADGTRHATGTFRGVAVP